MTPTARNATRTLLPQPPAERLCLLPVHSLSPSLLAEANSNWGMTRAWESKEHESGGENKVNLKTEIERALSSLSNKYKIKHHTPLLDIKLVKKGHKLLNKNTQCRQRCSEIAIFLESDVARDITRVHSLRTGNSMLGSSSLRNQSKT